MAAHKKTHCIHGHELTPKNLYWWHGRRSCLECRKTRSRSEENHARLNKKYKTDKKFRNKARERAAAHYKKKTSKEHRQHTNAQRESRKLEALTHYGKKGKLVCCWKGCTVSDIDMLSLDHINDDGAEHRRKMAGNRVSFSGKELYQWVITQGFPEGLQTLCMNHQVKKQRIKNRAERLDSDAASVGKE